MKVDSTFFQFTKHAQRSESRHSMASAPYLMQAGASAYGVSVPAGTQPTQGFSHSAGTLPFPAAIPLAPPTFATWVGGIQAPFTTGPQGTVGGGGGGGGGGFAPEYDTPKLVGQSAAGVAGALAITGTPTGPAAGLTAGIPSGGAAAAPANVTFSNTGCNLQHGFGTATVKSAGTLSLIATPTNTAPPVPSDIVIFATNRVLIDGNYTAGGGPQTSGTMALDSAPSAAAPGGVGTLVFAGSAGAGVTTCNQYMPVSFGTDGGTLTFLIPLIPTTWYPDAAPNPLPAAGAPRAGAGAGGGQMARMSY
jgi:hypothetical protein